jgi:hypothetical protein
MLSLLNLSCSAVDLCPPMMKMDGARNLFLTFCCSIILRCKSTRSNESTNRDRTTRSSTTYRVRAVAATWWLKKVAWWWMSCSCIELERQMLQLLFIRTPATVFRFYLLSVKCSRYHPLTSLNNNVEIILRFSACLHHGMQANQ